jgi:hypothetical protein
MYNVIPKPMRRAFTGVTDPDGCDGLLSEFPGLTGVLSLSTGLFGFVVPPLDFGRLLLGFAEALEPTVFSLGRDVRNAPRTSSSSWGIGDATAIANAQTHTNPRTITLNRISGSP